MVTSQLQVAIHPSNKRRRNISFSDVAVAVQNYFGLCNTLATFERLF
jgi:hypothetical protein